MYDVVGMQNYNNIFSKREREKGVGKEWEVRRGKGRSVDPDREEA